MRTIRRYLRRARLVLSLAAVVLALAGAAEGASQLDRLGISQMLGEGSVGATGSRPGAAAESSGVARTTNCERPKDVVNVGLSKTKYPDVLAHAHDAARQYGSVWTINRVGASARRDKLLSGIPTKPGMDRDEAPAAFARRSYKASVRYVESGQNRSAGSVMGTKTRRYCDGVKFRLVGY